MNNIIDARTMKESDEKELLEDINDETIIDEDFEDNESESTPSEEENESIRQLIERLKSMKEEYDNDYNFTDPSEYHNKAVSFAKSGDYKEATDVCIKGLEHFPNDVDLIADIVKYASESGRKDIAEDYCEQLKNRVDDKRWNWRCFSFVFDYLIKDPTNNENECRELIKKYKNLLPWEEKAWFCESDLEEALGNIEKSIETLKEAVRTHSNASQCALKLLEHQLERGLYKDALVTAKYGESITEPQPSTNEAYFSFCATLIEDHLLRIRAVNGEQLPSEEIKNLQYKYKTLISRFRRQLFHYKTTMETRLNMLYLLREDASEGIDPIAMPFDG